MGLSVADAGLLCVSESWACADVLFQKLPRKSEMANVWREAKGGREEGVRGQRQGGRKGREGGRQETDDEARLLAQPPPPSLLHPISLFCLLSSVLLLTSLPFASLHYFEALDCFPACLAIGWLAVCHHNQHSKTILRTFYPNPVPFLSPLEFPEEVGRRWRGSVWGRQTKYCWLSGVRPEPSSFSHMPSTFFLSSQWEFLCLELLLALQKTGVKCGGNLKPCSGLLSMTFLPSSFSQGRRDPPPRCLKG